MRKNHSKKAKVLVLFTALAFLFAQGVPANAANKTITCYNCQEKFFLMQTEIKSLNFCSNCWAKAGK